MTVWLLMTHLVVLFEVVDPIPMSEGNSEEPRLEYRRRIFTLMQK